jgi:hypothetical protein
MNESERKEKKNRDHAHQSALVENLNWKGVVVCGPRWRTHAHDAFYG